MRLVSNLSVIFALSLLVGCNEDEVTVGIRTAEVSIDAKAVPAGTETVTVDATSESRVLVSISRMATMDPESEQKLRTAVSVIAHHSLMMVDYTDPDIETTEDVRQKSLEIFLGRIDGMSADEIIAEMERIEDNQ